MKIICLSGLRQTKMVPYKNIVKTQLCISISLYFLLLLQSNSPCDRFKFNSQSFASNMCHYLPIEKSYFIQLMADKSMEGTILHSQNHKKASCIILYAKIIFCLFSKRSIMKPSVSLPQTEKASKNTSPGFLFDCFT